MCACQLEVCFDREGRSYRPGETIRGEVVVTSNKEVSCRGLEIELLWQTHGAGNKDRTVLDHIALGPQRWSPGSPWHYTFSFAAPVKPLTYHGHFLNVDHYIAARADLPMAIDAKTSEEYLLLPGPSSRTEYLAAPVDFTQSQSAQSGPAGKVIGWILLPAILGLVAVLLGFLLPILLAVGAVVVLRRWLAERRLGRVTVDVNTPEVGRSRSAAAVPLVGRLSSWWRGDKVHAVSPGEPVRFHVRFQPRGHVDLDRVSAKLIGTEECRSGSGSDAKTHKHAICEQELVLAQGLACYPGTPMDLAGELLVPDIEAYSFRSHNNALKWRIEVKIEAPRWPDWSRDTTLALVPRAVSP
ncbi:MAG: hypothetical protein AB1714_10085 [Acidobacteriota bacterium]